MWFCYCFALHQGFADHAAFNDCGVGLSFLLIACPFAYWSILIPIPTLPGRKVIRVGIPLTTKLYSMGYHESWLMTPILIPGYLLNLEAQEPAGLWGMLGKVHHPGHCWDGFVE